MTGTMTLLMVIVGIVLLGLLVTVWLLATRVKRRIETADEAVVSRTVKVSDGCVQRLRTLSEQPVLLKLDEGVLRYQVDDRPMAPVAVAPGSAAVALREVGAAVGVLFGERWVVLVHRVGADELAVDRLS